jgi:phenylalanyl-tRNA synthetase beta chain
VDATNFAWLAMGQPTHAFDLDKIEGGIVVRRALKGERLKTLDGVERVLDPEDLIVADHAKPLGLAGVMGGWDTMITAATTNVLVEAAWFEPMAVRRAGTGCTPTRATALSAERTSMPGRLLRHW